MNINIFLYIAVSPALCSVLKEEIRSCSKNQFTCRDGTCIPFDGKCDGVVDCPDSSDETHALCRTLHRVSRETLWLSSENVISNPGDCVLPAYPEHGSYLTDIAYWQPGGAFDAITINVNCNTGYSVVGSNIIHCQKGRWNESTIPKCARLCKLQPHPSVEYKCRVTGAVSGFRACNELEPHGTTVIPQCRTPNYHGLTDLTDMTCSEGNWSYVARCHPVSPPGSESRKERNSSRPKPEDCVLPPYPKHGYYVSNIPNGKPGDAYKEVFLNFTCNTGYGIEGSNSIYCRKGRWPELPLPKCAKFCKLRPHPSVEYKCLISGDITGSRDCKEFEPHGTTVIPQCRAPIYYSPTTLTRMRCVEGNWDHIARCNPECGRVTPRAVELTIGGNPAEKELTIGGHPAETGDIPWHAGIYRKTTNPYMQICGGSLISNTIVISAANCFWTDIDKALPATDFAVAVGKIYRPWNNNFDESEQKSDVRDIKLPASYQGTVANNQDDLAIVIVSTAFESNTFVRPVCVDFDLNFERRQLQPGNIGKIAGWSVAAGNGKESPVLKVYDTPYVTIDTCLKESPVGFRGNIIMQREFRCAQFVMALMAAEITQIGFERCAFCRGGSGGGLAFPESDRGIERYYLRGILLTGPIDDHLDNANTMYTVLGFTQLIKHENFVKEYWTNP